MNERIANKYFNEIERKIISIFYTDKNESFTSRMVYAKLLGSHSYQYISVTIVNLETLGILKKTNGTDRRTMQYQFSDEYEELGKRICIEEEEKKLMEIAEKERETPKTEEEVKKELDDYISRVKKARLE